MDRWKGIVITAVVALLVAVVGIQSIGSLKTAPSPDAQAVTDLQNRAESLAVLKTEQTLTRDILLLQIEIAELRLKAVAPPVIEGEFIPKKDFTPDMKQ